MTIDDVAKKLRTFSQEARISGPEPWDELSPTRQSQWRRFAIAPGSSNT